MKAAALRRYVIPAFILTALLVSCSSLPAIKPTGPLAADTDRQCRRPFLSEPCRFVHAIEASLPGGSQGTFIGVAVVDPAAAAIRSALMTLEGFVLFDASSAKEIRVHRAVPPFGAHHLAERILQDIRLLFLAPEGPPAAVGLREDGATVCRYPEQQDRTTDVAIHRDGRWEIAVYDAGGERIRTVRASSPRDGIPEILELTGAEARKYTLRLRLIRAERLTKDEVAAVLAEEQKEE